MASHVSIKVKSGDKFRRFTGSDIKTLFPNLDKLKHKIVNLFNFAYKCDFTLKYIDEDGDEVSLVDDDDLNELLRQNLNPLTIFVTLKQDRHDMSSVNFSGSSRFAEEVFEHSKTLTLRATIDLVLELIKTSSLLSNSIVEKLKSGDEFEKEKKKLEQKDGDCDDDKKINVLNVSPKESQTSPKYKEANDLQENELCLSRKMTPECSEFHGIENKRDGINSNIGLIALPKLKFDASSTRKLSIKNATKSEAAFTQIWQMCNVGSVPWPKGTNFVCIEGDSLAKAKVHDIKIPENGLPTGNSIDIAVDFTTPENPGVYRSSWTMSLPSGETFGDKVKISILVDASTKALTYDKARLKAYKLTSRIRRKLALRSLQRSKLDDTINASYSNLGTHVTITDHEAEAKKSKDDHESGSDDIVEAEAESENESLSEKTCCEDEESVLAKLSEMGFAESGFTREVLKVHGYDIEKSMDYLCGDSEWDLILDELRELDFKSGVVNVQIGGEE